MLQEAKSVRTMPVAPAHNSQLSKVQSTSIASPALIVGRLLC